MVAPAGPRLLVGISGASGAVLGVRLLQVAPTLGIETHLILSPAAEHTLALETDWKAADVRALAAHSYAAADLAAPPASGSFPSAGMVIVPCAIKTLSAVANSYTPDLLTRAADVTLKEGRPLLLVVRETPLHRGHLRLLTLAAEAGAVIFPPVPAFYQRPQTIAELVDHTVGRILARLGFANDLYPTWGAEEEFE